MKETIKQEFDAKTMTAQEAVKLVNSGETVFIGICSSTAYALCEALGERLDELEGLTIACSMLLRPLKILSGKNNTRINPPFMGSIERRGLAGGYTDFSSVHLSQVDLWCTQGAPADVAFLEVSPPDEDGYMSFGATGVGLFSYVCQVAKKIILQVNRNVPRVFGEQHRIHISQADAAVFADQPLVENPPLQVGETIQTISSYLLDQIPDGACIQLGLGGVAEAVGNGLGKKNDLGAHTELMTTSMMNLMKKGVLTNKRKNFMPGVTVAAFAFGSGELYRFLDNNPTLYFMPFPVVNDPTLIAKNDNMISINTALSIDLMGQVNADNLSGQQYSAVGGQLDFVRGAQMSKGGKSFLAIESTVDNRAGRSSRIVSRFPLGTAVTTPRADVQYVVTEFGCVNLKPLCMRDRVRAMISLAHPDFRPQLTDEAKATGLL